MPWQVAHEYYFVLYVHDSQLKPTKDSFGKKQLDSKLTGTSDVSPFTSTPEFKSKTFYFSLNPAGEVSEELYLKESCITCQLFAAHSSPRSEDNNDKGISQKEADSQPATDELLGTSTANFTVRPKAKSSSA